MSYLVVYGIDKLGNGIYKERIWRCEVNLIPKPYKINTSYITIIPQPQFHRGQLVGVLCSVWRFQTYLREITSLMICSKPTKENGKAQAILTEN